MYLGGDLFHKRKNEISRLEVGYAGYLLNDPRTLVCKGPSSNMILCRHLVKKQSFKIKENVSPFISEFIALKHLLRCSFYY